MINIDVYADIACPWCYIGSNRLKTAIETRPNLQITRSWRPFQLQPDLPEGQDWKSFAEAKFGGWERALASFEHVRRAAGDTEIHFNLEGIATAANTLDAHRLILFARKHGQEWKMAKSLFRAFFSDSIDLNDWDRLVDLAEKVGLKAESTRSMLESDRFINVVVESQQEATRLGIHGVPFYVLNGRYAIQGAQPMEVFLEAFDEIEKTGPE